MYAVVGCNECDALWVVEGRPETTGCPRCGKRHQFGRLKQFASAEDEATVREARAALLAKRQGESEAYADLDPMAEMDTDRDAVADDEYLAASGLDPDEVAAAGERADEGAASGGTSRRETVLAALRELDAPAEEDVVAYASERGVDAEYAREALDRLVRAGEVTASGDAYRLL
jgi:predicted  nucleic acid-binding Zn-ribbon protein